MAGYNRVIMIGNLTRDPEYKQLSSGQAVCRLGLASNRQFKNRQSGDMVQEVCYVDIDVWGSQAESCRQYLQKGRPVLVEGRLKLDTWQDQDGGNRSKHSIVADRVVFLSSGVEAEVESVSGKEPQFEKEMLEQISQVKAKNDANTFKNAESIRPAKSVSPKAEPVKNASFKEPFVQEFQDEPPFQDELPF